MSNTAESNTKNGHSETPTFRTENIGKWKAKQESPFAAQNRATAEQKARKAAKKSARNKQLKPIFKIIAIVFGALAIVAGIVWLVIFIITRPAASEPPVIDGSSESLNDYVGDLQEIYDQEETGNLQGVIDNVNEATKLEENAPYLNQIVLSEMQFYINNSLYPQIIENVDKINPEALSLEQRAQFYNIAYYAYSALGYTEEASKYSELAFKAFEDLNQQAEEGAEN